MWENTRKKKLSWFALSTAVNLNDQVFSNPVFLVSSQLVLSSSVIGEHRIGLGDSCMQRICSNAEL